MSKIVELLFRSFSLYQKPILISLLIVVFISISVWCYFRFAKNTIKHQKETDIPNKGGKGETIYLHFFSVDWCPHCVKAKPEWERFCEKYDGSEINGNTISCVGGKTGVDCTKSEDPKVSETIQMFNIEHYPTLKMVKNEDTIDFDAKIQYDNLVTFVKTVLS